MAIKFYGKERDLISTKHPDLNAAPCTFEDARTLILRLAKEHGVRIDEVRKTSGRRGSFWRSRERRVVLNAAEGWPTAIHEFAHALDDKLRPESHRWHDSAFLDLVDDLCRVVEARGWHKSIPLERVAEEATAYALKQAREAREVEKRSPENIRARKIESRKAQVAWLATRIKMLTTRLKKARRSLAALERAASRKGE